MFCSILFRKKSHKGAELIPANALFGMGTRNFFPSGTALQLLFQLLAEHGDVIPNLMPGSNSLAQHASEVPDGKFMPVFIARSSRQITCLHSWLKLST